MMTHPHEHLMKTFDYHNLPIFLVTWDDSLWCGKLAYAPQNTGEPDVESLAASAASLFSSVPPEQREEHWEVCISLNYLTNQRPNGVMFGYLTSTPQQPDGYDILHVPCGMYMKLRICEETASALGVPAWTGGIPPYEWIGEILAPALGYQYGLDTLPIIEYYWRNPANGQMEDCYLYVPVQEK